MEDKEPSYEMKSTYQVNGTDLDQRKSIGVGCNFMVLSLEEKKKKEKKKKKAQ